MTNSVTIAGKVVEFVFSHEVMGCKMYRGIMSIQRHSGVADNIPFITWCDNINVGEFYQVDGEVNTFNKIDEIGIRHKETFVKVHSIAQCEEKYDNRVELIGFIVKREQARITPFGKLIVDFVMALNGKYRKSFYPSMIAWGSGVHLVGDIQIGDKIHIIGRFQSREYSKLDETRTAYEISCKSIDMNCEEDSNDTRSN